MTGRTRPPRAINLHHVLYAFNGETVVDIWPITARGYPEQRSSIE
jgi:hypothetical protein